jgi:hypothetical protein
MFALPREVPVHSSFRIIRLAGAAAGVLAMILAAAPAALAHTEQHVGDYHVLIGWLNEPALVGQLNAVQLTITDHADKPVTDLGPDDLKVVISTGGHDSQALAVIPAFDTEEGFGNPGEYHADLIPTAPGDYTFHVTGSIHGTTADLTVVSGPQTFDAIEGTSDLEFPVKQPTLTEVGTRLDRLDSRIAALQSGAPATGQQDLDELRAAAAAAQSAATQAQGIAALGVVLAVVAVALALRATRRTRGAA